jgi:long-chain acyl-CoA synthetase
MERDPIVRGFEIVLGRSPEASLVVSPRESWTVERVDGSARALASRIGDEGLSPGCGVALVAPNGPGFLAAYLAALRARCVVALVDARAPVSERVRIARALRLDALLTVTRAWPADGRDFRVERVRRPERDPAVTYAEAVSTIRVTSGSTGTPRGILVTSEALLADDRQLTTTMGLRDREGILASVPLSHSYGLSSIVMPALARGSSIIIPEENGPFGAIDAAWQCQATFFPTAPAFLEGLLKLDDARGLPTTLRRVVSAGAPLHPATAARFREVHGRPVHVFYGASECGGISFDREGGAGERGTVGSPVDGVTIDLVPIAGEPEGSGTVRVRSPAVAEGYHPLPDDSLSGGCFRSQDLGTFEDGELRLLGRVDDMIVVRGKKVSPREVEAVLGSLAGVTEVTVVGVTPSVGSDPIVRAVVATADPSLDSERVLEWCRPRLTAHKVPRSVIIVDEIPRNPRGKIDRRALAGLAKREP